jgi:hypothetical protein
MIIFLLPTWTLWPNSVLNAFQMFATDMAKLNFIFPIDTFFTCIVFFINFEIFYFGAKIITKIFNFLRGTGSGIEL